MSVAVILLDNPPVNGLGHALRTAIVEQLDRANADPSVKAMVIAGAGKLFSGGADIREFGTARALAQPTLGTVIRAIEESAKPVVAALNGTAMGGGLELALACHYRVSAPGVTVGLPEVKLGILPGAGGTQRLPRLVGLEAALEMIVGGNPVPVEKLRGLCDELLAGDVVEGAVAFAAKIADRRPLPLVRRLEVKHPSPEAFLGFARAAVAAAARGLPAPPKCVDAVEAAVKLPFDEGLAAERALFVGLMQTTESRALRHVFFAERAASKIPDVPEDTPVRPIGSAAVIGAGTMGGGIAMSLANAGIAVTLLETSQEALDRGVARIRATYESSAKKGKLTAAQLADRLGLIRPTLSYAGVAEADLVVEAVFEDLGVKEAVFRKLDEVARPGAILATNTSTLDVDRIASFTRRPEDVLGLHFFSPAHVMRLLEIVRGARTGKDVLATAMALSKRLKKLGVVSGVCDGFIGNRMLAPYLGQCMWMLEEGASPRQVDRALEAFGMAMGPFRVADLAGNDIGWSIRKRRRAENPDLRYPRVADRICELGRFGQKTGAGWYRYEPGGRDALPDPAVDEIIAAHRRELGITPRAISDEEIVERAVLALVNEGARILEEGIAARASDIDLVYLTGYGFPAARGGPMFYADTLGLYDVARALRRHAGHDAATFTPAPLLERLVAEGKTFH
jgi:3-hydroxyacyl-CoA dehydrogenase